MLESMAKPVETVSKTGYEIWNLLCDVINIWSIYVIIFFKSVYKGLKSDSRKEMKEKSIIVWSWRSLKSKNVGTFFINCV